MIVNVSFFAAVKDMMGTESMELSLDDAATVGERGAHAGEPRRVLRLGADGGGDGTTELDVTTEKKYFYSLAYITSERSKYFFPLSTRPPSCVMRWLNKRQLPALG